MTITSSTPLAIQNCEYQVKISPDVHKCMTLVEYNEYINSPISTVDTIAGVIFGTLIFSFCVALFLFMLTLIKDLLGI